MTKHLPKGERKAMAVELRRQGLTTTEIAEHLGVSRPYVRDTLLAETPTQRRKIEDSILLRKAAELIRNSDGDMTRTRLAKGLGINSTKLAEVLTRDMRPLLLGVNNGGGGRSKQITREDCVLAMRAAIEVDRSQLVTQHRYDKLITTGAISGPSHTVINSWGWVQVRIAAGDLSPSNQRNGYALRRSWEESEVVALVTEFLADPAPESSGFGTFEKWCKSSSRAHPPRGWFFQAPRTWVEIRRRAAAGLCVQLQDDGTLSRPVTI